jgi:RNA polymerase sigma-70 factor (ECF subfamily)
MEEETQLLSAEEVAQLYQEHGENLQRFLQGVLRDHTLAADCLQVTFAKLLQKGGQTRPESRKGWLFAVAYQEAMLARRKGATSDRILRQVAWQPLPAAENPEAGLLQAESAQRVQQALAELPPEQRQVVRLRIYENKTFAEIAAELKIPLGTALGRMRGALLKLKRILAES